MAESISEGTLSTFTKQVGDYVELDEEIASIETDKIDVSVNAPEAGTITELLVNEGDTVTVGQEIAKIEPGEGGGGAPKEAEAPKEEKPAEPKSEPKKEDTPAPPPPKKEDKPAPPPKKEDKAPAKQDKSEGIKSPMGKGERNENRVKMNRMRLRIAERLKQSQNTAAALTTFNEVDMSSIMEFRKLYKDEVLKQTGIKLGFMSAFTKACVMAMKDVPTVNASIEGPGGGDTIVYRDFVDISVAVATPKGLVTPVVRNVESMEMVEIEQEIANLGKKVCLYVRVRKSMITDS
jgi:2-oxoglutarate dehydrogenase E2 component (dihydrolipoamide succinyltransferase)